jgi:hypothetical protein
MVPQTYNPIYLGGGGWEDHRLRPVWAKMFMTLHLNLDMRVHACLPSYTGKHKQEDQGPHQPRVKVRTYLKNNQHKKGW